MDPDIEEVRMWDECNYNLRCIVYYQVSGRAGKDESASRVQYCAERTNKVPTQLPHTVSTHLQTCNWSVGPESGSHRFSYEKPIIRFGNGKFVFIFFFLNDLSVPVMALGYLLAMLVINASFLSFIHAIVVQRSAESKWNQTSR
jgi:hypothetical protein